MHLQFSIKMAIVIPWYILHNLQQWRTQYHHQASCTSTFLDGRKCKLYWKYMDSKGAVQFPLNLARGLTENDTGVGGGLEHVCMTISYQPCAARRSTLLPVVSEDQYTAGGKDSFEGQGIPSASRQPPYPWYSYSYRYVPRRGSRGLVPSWVVWERDMIFIETTLCMQLIMANLLRGKLDSFCSPGSLFWVCTITRV